MKTNHPTGNNNIIHLSNSRGSDTYINAISCDNKADKEAQPLELNLCPKNSLTEALSGLPPRADSIGNGSTSSLMEATVPTVHSSQQVMKAEDSPDKGDSEKDTSLLTSTEIPHHDDPAVSNAIIEEILNIILPNSEPEMIMQVTCNKPVKLDVLLMKLQKTIEDCRLLN